MQDYPKMPIYPNEPANGLPTGASPASPTGIEGPRPLILHLDVDAFFAAVEQRDDRRLRGRPVAVGTGVVASCSYEARRYGVRTAMPLREARKLCPALRVLTGDYHRYELAGRRIAGICLDATPRVEVAALDDLYLMVPRTVDPLSPSAPVEWAERLRMRIRDEVGLEVSAGIARGRFIAGVATQDAKEGRRLQAGHCNGTPPPSLVRLVMPGHEREFLEPFCSSLLPGAGALNARRLHDYGLVTLGLVAGAPKHLLEGLFGAIGRDWTSQAAGIDNTTLRESRQPRSLSRSASFDPPLADRKGGQLRAMLDYLVTRAALELRSQGRVAAGLRIHIRYGDFTSVDGHSRLDSAADDDTTLRAAAHDRLTRVLTRRLPVRSMGVEFTAMAARSMQKNLFEDPELLRRQRLDSCADAIRARFGFLAIRPGATLVLDEQFPAGPDGLSLRTPCLSR